MVVLQLNFDYPSDKMGDALIEMARDLADSINTEEGFISKIWIENPDTSESGGIYVFKDMESAKKYLDMHIIRVKNMGIENISSKLFYINETLSKVNKGI